MTRHCNSCVWPSFAGHQSGHVPATRDLAKTVRSSKKWVKQVKQLNSQTISNLSWRGLRSAVEGKVMHIKKSTTTRNILCCFVRHSVPQAQAMKIRSDFEGHWWAFENDEPPGCEAKQGMGYPFILLASTLSPNLFNNLRVAGAWRRGRILQGASWILQKHRVHAIRWQQKSSILLEDKKGKGNGKDLSKSGRLLERSMPESLNFSLIVCCVLFLMSLLQSNASDDSATFCLRGKQWSLWQPVICKWGAGAKLPTSLMLLFSGHSDFIFRCTVWFSLRQGCILQNADVKRTSRTKRWTEIRLSNAISAFVLCVANSKFS